MFYIKNSPHQAVIRSSEEWSAFYVAQRPNKPRQSAVDSQNMLLRVRNRAYKLAEAFILGKHKSWRVERAVHELPNLRLVASLVDSICGREIDTYERVVEWYYRDRVFCKRPSGKIVFGRPSYGDTVFSAELSDFVPPPPSHYGPVEVDSLLEAIKFGEGWEYQLVGTGLGMWDSSVWIPCSCPTFRRSELLHDGKWRVRKKKGV